MTPFEQNTHVFIIRVWRESREIEGATPQWRGVIEHVTSGERRYVQNLNDISAFIATYLLGMGIKPANKWRIKQWLNRWKQLKILKEE